MRKYVTTELAPTPRGCYSQAVSSDNILYHAGQIGLDPLTGQLSGQDFEAQFTQILENTSAIAQAAGSDLTKVVKLTVYLKNFDEDYPKVDNVMSKFFEAPYPARTTIGVAQLPANALVEVDAITAVE